MLRSQALVFHSRQIFHFCPYKAQDQPLALCYQRAQDVKHRDYCYGCEHVDVLKQRFGLRTFKRVPVFGRCKHCDETYAVHQNAPPHKCTRIPWCPGYEAVPDEGTLYVALDEACTSWMAVDAATGERMTLADRRNDRRYRLPLLGAPGTVPSDGADELRAEAAKEAASVRNRNAPQISEEEHEENLKNKPTKTTKRKRK